MVAMNKILKDLRERPKNVAPMEFASWRKLIAQASKRDEKFKKNSLQLNKSDI